MAEVAKVKENHIEFSLKINGRVVVNKYFALPEYNPKVRVGQEMRYLTDDIQGLISDTLKTKDVDAQWDNYRKPKSV